MPRLWDGGRADISFSSAPRSLTCMAAWGKFVRLLAVPAVARRHELMLEQTAHNWFISETIFSSWGILTSALVRCFCSHRPATEDLSITGRNIFAPVRSNYRSAFPALTVDTITHRCRIPYGSRLFIWRRLRANWAA